MSKETYVEMNLNPKPEWLGSVGRGKASLHYTSQQVGGEGA